MSAQQLNPGRVVRLCAVLAACAVVTPVAAQEQQTMAVWKDRELTFHYRGDNVLYSCSALEGRVKQILRAVGVRDDVRVRTSYCDEFMTPMDPTMSSWPNRRPYGSPNRPIDQFVSVRIKLKHPVEATDEVLDELAKNKTRRELVARVTGKKEVLDEANQSEAHWQKLTLLRKNTDLEGADCDLVDQMSRSVLPQLGVRVLRRDYLCDSHSISRIPPKLTVEALFAGPIVTGQTGTTKDSGAATEPENAPTETTAPAVESSSSGAEPAPSPGPASESAPTPQP